MSQTYHEFHSRFVDLIMASKCSAIIMSRHHGFEERSLSFCCPMSTSSFEIVPEQSISRIANAFEVHSNRSSDYHHAAYYI